MRMHSQQMAIITNTTLTNVLCKEMKYQFEIFNQNIEMNKFKIEIQQKIAFNEWAANM